MRMQKSWSVIAVALASASVTASAATLGTATVTNAAHYGRRGNVNNTVSVVTPAVSAPFGSSVRWIGVSGTLTAASVDAWGRDLRVQPSGSSLATGPGTPKGQGYFQFSGEYEFTTLNVSAMIAVPGGIAANLPMTLEAYSPQSEVVGEGVPGLDGRSTLTYTFYNAIPNGGAEFSGALASTDPVYTRATNFNADADGPIVSGLSGVGTSVYYDVQPFTVAADGTYAIAVAAGFDTHLTLYAGSFDPADAMANFVDANNDGRNTLRRSSLAALDVDNDTNGISRLDKVLVAGTQYFAVTSSYANGETGAYLAQIGGLGAVTLGVIPEPTTIAGVAALAMFARRRR